MDQTMELLEAVAENSEMGKNTLAQILQMTDDAALSAELKRERDLYRDVNRRAHAAMADLGGQVRGQTTWAKTMTRMGICMETFRDKSTRKLAEMLIEGSNQGVMDCVKSISDHPEAGAEAVALARELEEMQQDSIRRLKRFLG